MSTGDPSNALPSDAPLRAGGGLAGWLRTARTAPMVRAVGAVGGARALGAGGGLMLVLVLGRWLGAADLGLFAFSQAVCMIGVLMARGGQDEVLLRSVSRAMTEHDLAGVEAHARFAMANSLKIAAGLLAVSLGWVYANPWGLLDSGKSGLLLIMLPAMPAAALAWQVSGFFKGLRQGALAVLFENGGAVLLTILAFTLAVGTGLAPARVETVGLAFLAAHLGVAGAGLCLYRRWTRRRARAGDAPVVLTQERPALFASNRQFFTINLSSYMTEAGCFVIAGLLLPGELVGLLWAAERLILAIGFIFLVAGPILQPRIAAAFHRQRLDELAVLAARARLLCMLVGLPVAGALLLFPRPLLALAGAEFVAAAPYLQIMAIGQIARILVGPIHHMLTMTRHEEVMRKLTAALFLASLAAYPAAIAAWGALGFAACHASLAVARYLAIAVLVRRKLGLRPLGGSFRPVTG